MSDDDFLELFSDFLMDLRMHEVSHCQRHRILHQADAALKSIFNDYRIDLSETSPGSRVDQHLNNGEMTSSQKHLLERIGRAVFTEHPNHLKFREIFELLDIDQDGMISAADLHKGLKDHMKTDIPIIDLETVLHAFDRNQKGKLHYFQFVQMLQIAMQNAIKDEDQIIHTIRPPFLSDERELLDQIGLYIDSSPHAGLIKELFFSLSKTYPHLVTSDEILKFCRVSGITSANKDTVDRIIDHFNPRASNSDVHALSYAQFARLCSESANWNFKHASEAENSPVCSSAESNLASLSLQS